MGAAIDFEANATYSEFVRRALLKSPLAHSHYRFGATKGFTPGDICHLKLAHYFLALIDKKVPHDLAVGKLFVATIGVLCEWIKYELIYIWVVD